MNRGPLLRLLRLDRTTCDHCRRDILFRPGAYPMVCRWCGEPTIDFAALTEVVQKMAAAMGAAAQAFRGVAASVLRAAHAFRVPVIAHTYVVDVETATHDDLRGGETATRYSRVQVLARDEVEAKLVACQMVARSGRMPTRATVRGPRELREEEEARQITLAYRMDNPLRHAVELRKDVP